MQGYTKDKNKNNKYKINSSKEQINSNDKKAITAEGEADL